MQIPDKGHGPIVRGEDGQIRDNLSRLWCACGKAAVIYRSGNLPQYQFLCLEHMKDDEDQAEYGRT